MKVTQRNFTEEDVRSLNESGMNGNFIAQNRVILEFEDDGHTAVLYIESEVVERLGLEYIAANTVLEYSKVCEEYLAHLSQNNFYNDTARFPEKTIPVAFVERVPGEDTEVYKATGSDQYYLRMLSRREPFAKWLMTSRNNGRYSDGPEIRANITFENNGQFEKIFYDDWDGPGAYKETFNPKFNSMAAMPS